YRLVLLLEADTEVAMLQGVGDHFLDPDLDIQYLVLRHQAGELQCDLVDNGKVWRIRPGDDELLRLFEKEGRKKRGSGCLEPEVYYFPYLLDELPHVEGFLEEVRGAAAQRLQKHLLVSLSGHENDRGVSVDPLDLVQKSEAVHFRHHDVRHDDERGLRFEELDRFFAVSCLDRVESLSVQQVRQEGPQRLLVVHHKNSRPATAAHGGKATTGSNHCQAETRLGMGLLPQALAVCFAASCRSMHPCARRPSPSNSAEYR